MPPSTRTRTRATRKGSVLLHNVSSLVTYTTELTVKRSFFMTVLCRSSLTFLMGRIVWYFLTVWRTQERPTPLRVGSVYTRLTVWKPRLFLCWCVRVQECKFLQIGICLGGSRWILAHSKPSWIHWLFRPWWGSRSFFICFHNQTHFFHNVPFYNALFWKASMLKLSREKFSTKSFIVWVASENLLPKEKVVIVHPSKEGLQNTTACKREVLKSQY